MVVILLVLIVLNLWAVFHLINIEADYIGQKKSLQRIIERKEAEIIKLNKKIKDINSKVFEAEV